MKVGSEPQCKMGNMTISEQLRAAVAGSGLSIYAVAKGAGIAEPCLNRFMRRKRGLTLETADKLAAFFTMRLTRPRKPQTD